MEDRYLHGLSLDCLFTLLQALTLEGIPEKMLVYMKVDMQINEKNFQGHQVFT